MRTFLERGKNGRKQPYIMYFARACVRAHACTRTDKQEEACTHKGIAAVHTKKNRLKNRSRPEFSKIEEYISPDIVNQT